MSTFTLERFEIEALEEQIQRKTNLPWKFKSCQCSGPEYVPIFCFAFEMEIGPEDQDNRSKICATAQSDVCHGKLNLYGIRLEGDAIEALQILDMMHQ